MDASSTADIVTIQIETQVETQVEILVEIRNGAAHLRFPDWQRYDQTAIEAALRTKIADLRREHGLHTFYLRLRVSDELPLIRVAKRCHFDCYSNQHRTGRTWKGRRHIR